VAVTYLLCLLMSLGCMILLDRRFRLVFWRSPRTAVVVLALGMSACSSDEQPQEETTSSVDPAPETSDPQESTAEATESAEPADDAANTQSGEASDEATDEATGEETGGLAVTVAGEHGVLALQYTGAAPEGAAGPTGHKVITGPGGCFALTQDGKPQLLVFPEDATFVLEDGKPSVTIDGTEYPVGQQFTVETTEVAKSEVTGIPQRCAKGSSDTVLVVN